MRSIIVFFLIASTHAVMPQQQQQRRAPVYSTPMPVMSGMPMTTTMKMPEYMPPSTPAPATPTILQPQAQAREGTEGQAGAAAQSPNSQNYLVYYYPQPDYRSVPVQPNYAGTAPESSGFFRNIPWADVGYIAASVVLLAAGGTLVYNGVGASKQVTARAMRELSELSYDDASSMARRVFRAIEKFQHMNEATE